MPSAPLTLGIHLKLSRDYLTKGTEINPASSFLDWMVRQGPELPTGGEEEHIKNVQEAEQNLLKSQDSKEVTQLSFK